MTDVRLEHVEFLGQPGADEGVAGVEIDLDVWTVNRRHYRREGFGARRRGVTHMDIVLDHDGGTDRRRQVSPLGDRLDGALLAVAKQLIAAESLDMKRHPLSFEITESGNRARMDAEDGGADLGTDVQHPLHQIVVVRSVTFEPGRGIDFGTSVQGNTEILAPGDGVDLGQEGVVDHAGLEFKRVAENLETLKVVVGGETRRTDGIHHGKQRPTMGVNSRFHITSFKGLKTSMFNRSFPGARSGR